MEEKFKHLQILDEDTHYNDIKYEMKEEFYNVDTLDEFLYLYSLIYENRVIMKNYYRTFYGRLESDNPQATYELGQKFKQLTLKGLILTDSQVSLPNQQKAYMCMFVPFNLASKLTNILNCYNCIIAFSTDFDNNKGVNGLYVTYKNNKSLATHVGEGSDLYVYQSIYNLLNPSLQNMFDHNNYCQLTVIDANFNNPQEYLVDLLLDVVNKL